MGGRAIPPADAHMARVTGARAWLRGAALPTDAGMRVDPPTDRQRGRAAMGGRAWLRGLPCHGGRNVPPTDGRMARVTGNRVRLHRAAGTVPTDARRAADPATDRQRGGWRWAAVPWRTECTAADGPFMRVTGDWVRLPGGRAIPARTH